MRHPCKEAEVFVGPFVLVRVTDQAGFVLGNHFRARLEAAELVVSILFSIIPILTTII